MKISKGNPSGPHCFVYKPSWVRRAGLLLACIELVLLGCLGPFVTAGDSPGFWFGKYRDTISGLFAPADVVLSSDGTLFVANAGAGTICSKTPTGPLTILVSGLLEPSALCLDGSELWVSDSASHQVMSFQTDGKLIRKWGQLGQAPGQLFRPSGLTVVGDRVYVADLGNDRVQVFDRFGAFLFVLAQPQDRSMKRPSDVVMGPSFGLYVSDSGNNRILLYSAEGKFLKSWGDWGTFPGLFDTPGCLLWSEGRLLVVDHRNHRIQAFEPDGKFIGLWGQHEWTPHEGHGKLHYPVAAAIDPAKGFAVVCEAIEDRIQVFDPDPAGISEPDLSATAQKGRHFGQQVSVQGSIMTLAEPEAHYVFLYDLRQDVPVNINTFGERGEGFGLMIDTAAVWLDLPGKRVLTSDLVLGRLQEYRLTFEEGAELKYLPDMAQFVESHDVVALSAKVPDLVWPIAVTDLDRGPDGLFYLLDGANRQVHLFSKDWSYVRSIGATSGKKGALIRPTDLAFVGDRLYVVDQLADKVWVFDKQGKPVFGFGHKGAGKLKRPFGIAADGQGSVYVSDSQHRIVKFKEKGKFQTQWGQRGINMGELWYPAGMAVDAQGRLIVVDYGNHRIQVFERDGTWRVCLGAGRAYTWKRPPRPILVEEQK